MIWLVDGNQLQLRNRRMILQCQMYRDNRDDNTGDKLACEQITHLHKPICLE